MPRLGSLASQTSPTKASLRCATRLEGYASARRPHVPDFTYKGFTATRRPPRRLCLGSAASRPKLRLQRFHCDAPPASKAMPRLGGLVSQTSPTKASLRRAARLEGYASARRPRVQDFAYIGFASTCLPPRRLSLDRAAPRPRLLPAYTGFVPMRRPPRRLCLGGVPQHSVLRLQEWNNKNYPTRRANEKRQSGTRPCVKHSRYMKHKMKIAQWT